MDNFRINKDSHDHRLCCIGCIIGLAMAIIGSLLEMSLSYNAPKKDRDGSEGMIASCALICLSAMVING